MLRAVLKDAAAIAGIAQTPFAKRLEPSEKALAATHRGTRARLAL